MKKLKEYLALIVTFIFILTIIQSPIIAKSKEKDKVYIKIRYNRLDKNYEGWNLWVWEKDKEGKKLDFIGEDDEGKFVVIETSKEANKLGFILRRSEKGNDWAENYFGEDKFLDLSKGDLEVLVKNKNSGEKTLKINPLKREFNKVNLFLHYYRFDGNYNNWDTWAWLQGKEGSAYGFLKEDSYGKISNIAYENVKNVENIGFIIRKSDWSDKDIGTDRFINLAYANNKGEVHGYIVEGNENIYYRPSDVIRDSKIIAAKIDTLNEINFKVNVKLSSKDIKDNVILKENSNLMEFSVSVPEDLLQGKIITNKKIDLTKKYTLEIKGYKSIQVTPGKIFSSKDFENVFNYEGDLGAIYSKNKTSFKLWSPTASEVKVVLYGKDGSQYENKAKEIIPMNRGEKGLWILDKVGDLNGEYYNYLVTIDGKENEVTDPYAKAVGVNGNRGMVVDLTETNPNNWDNDKKPELKSPTDSIIYEMHIRDFSIDKDSGVNLKFRGKYNGVWEKGTKFQGKDIKTGIDHLKELGVTHVHILPTFDHRSIDETKLDKPQYNWGYDPQNYNVPEGSYSQDPYTGEVRIKEFKEMVKALHYSGIRVVMDMVYNHTGATDDSNLNLAVPNYYYRQNSKGGFSNGSGCGNEIASERSMVRKLIVDSVVYWAKEYHIDGFRFDLMGLHDINTMKKIREELNKVDKSIIVYGEGWTGGDSPLPDDEKALKKNISKFKELQIAAFSDDIRDGIKGHVFNAEEPGFVNGKGNLEESIKFGVVAGTEHREIDYNKVNYSKKPWANEPYQSVNYESAHDNFTLWDKLHITNPKEREEELIKMNKMAAAIVLTSQGMPFLHSGEEFLRSKINPDGTFNENSYNAKDSVNMIDWSRKEKYKNVFDYYKGLIEIRKNHKGFRMDSNKDIEKNITFLKKGENFNDNNVVAYNINGKNLGDSWENIVVIFNANPKETEITLPDNNWVLVANSYTAGLKEIEKIQSNKVKVPERSSYILVKEESHSKENIEEGNKKNTNKNNTIKENTNENTKEQINEQKNKDNNKDFNSTKNKNIEDEISNNSGDEDKMKKEKTEKDNKIPKTGGHSSKVLALLGVSILTLGAVLLKKRKKA
ncbi:type I pullulanase [Clostridium fallax]|uniref:pullulanase n=1 Tax=Clostridium fallax TaxID=1533 RepID=A0A1M4YSH6_9CLOT|nr:type I pullulanase [Clostridium fallax]SHF08769.1 pullulanase [Clostridium fallax]SQB06200.1 alpha-dextran endo-1,6-alpha-glucosidase [Clostridium fallax]